MMSLKETSSCCNIGHILEQLETPPQTSGFPVTRDNSHHDLRKGTTNSWTYGTWRGARF